MAKSTGKIAQKYAKMLFNAVDLNEFESLYKQVLSVNELMKKNREINMSLCSPLFSTEEKTKTLSVLAGTLQLGELARKYLTHISEKGAVVLLDEILKKALDMYYEKKKKTVATVITSTILTGDLDSRLKASLKKLTAKDEIDVEYVKDPSLIGGFIVKVGSTMYDSSIKGQLRLLKDELIKG